jgi:hypothetical protein
MLPNLLVIDIISPINLPSKGFNIIIIIPCYSIIIRKSLISISPLLYILISLS